MEQERSNFKKVMLSFVLILSAICFALCFSASSCTNENNKTEEIATAQTKFNRSYVKVLGIDASTVTFSDDCEDIGNGDVSAEYYFNTSVVSGLETIRNVEIVFDKIVYVDAVMYSKLVNLGTPNALRYKLEEGQTITATVFLGTNEQNSKFYYIMNFDDNGNISTFEFQLAVSEHFAKIIYDFNTNKITTKNMTEQEKTNLTNRCNAIKTATPDISFVEEWVLKKRILKEFSFNFIKFINLLCY